MELVIKYAYLRDISKIEESNVLEMMTISDYFGVMGLNKHCINYIVEVMSPENCVMSFMISR